MAKEGRGWHEHSFEHQMAARGISLKTNQTKERFIYRAPVGQESVGEVVVARSKVGLATAIVRIEYILKPENVPLNLKRKGFRDFAVGKAIDETGQEAIVLIGKRGQTWFLLKLTIEEKRNLETALARTRDVVQIASAITGVASSVVGVATGIERLAPPIQISPPQIFLPPTRQIPSLPPAPPRPDLPPGPIIETTARPAPPPKPRQRHPERFTPEQKRELKKFEIGVKRRKTKKGNGGRIFTVPEFGE